MCIARNDTNSINPCTMMEEDKYIDRKFNRILGQVVKVNEYTKSSRTFQQSSLEELKEENQEATG